MTVRERLSNSQVVIMRWWVVALIGETVGDGEKLGALKREIVGECL
jgi:hypothetical protein